MRQNFARTQGFSRLKGEGRPHDLEFPQQSPAPRRELEPAKQGLRGQDQAGMQGVTKVEGWAQAELQGGV